MPLQAEHHVSKPAPRLKVELVRRGLTVSALAKKLGLPRTSVSRAIHQPRRLPGIRNLVVEALR